jgi:hypothetical protein
MGQWCAAQQVLMGASDSVVGSMNYTFIRDLRQNIIGGNWYVISGSGEIVSHTRLSKNITNTSEIIENVLDCRNNTLVSVEVDNSAGVTFTTKDATTFWVYNASSDPPQYFYKLLASHTSLVQANEIVAFACPPDSFNKTACATDGKAGQPGLSPIVRMTTPWFNLVVQTWTVEFNTSAAAAAAESGLPIQFTAALAAQIVGLATSPQSLSWCASCIAAIALVPLIILMVSCCFCHRRGCCRRPGAPLPYAKVLTANTEVNQYNAMFAVKNTRRRRAAEEDDLSSGIVIDGVDFAALSLSAADNDSESVDGGASVSNMQKQRDRGGSTRSTRSTRSERRPGGGSTHSRHGVGGGGGGGDGGNSSRRSRPPARSDLSDQSARRRSPTAGDVETGDGRRSSRSPVAGDTPQ